MAGVHMIVTSELRDYVEHRGGVLYVSTHRPHCCGAVSWVTASTAAPASDDGYEAVVANGILVRLRLPRGWAPDELYLGLEGRRTKHPVALWDGCAYVV